MLNEQCLGLQFFNSLTTKLPLKDNLFINYSISLSEQSITNTCYCSYNFNTFTI